jgi:F5/8 type C domain
VSSTADTVYLFIDGVLKGSCPRSAITPRDLPFQIGCTINFGGAAFNGYIDEVRFSQGVARWTADFTPPPQPYGSDGTVNLAFLHGMASANNSYSSDPPALGIDGDWQTGWAANGPGSPTIPYWLQVDLQKNYKVEQIVLVVNTLASYPCIYNLYTSADGTNWKLIQSGTIVDSTDPTVYVHTIPLTGNQIMRYVKYEAVGGTSWAYLMEMELWGGPKPIIPSVPQNFLLLEDLDPRKNFV